MTDPRGPGPADRPGPPNDAPETPTAGTDRRRRGASVGTTIGGILVGFDEQVWRRQPPAHELVQQVDRSMTVVAPGGLTIELPDGGSPREPAGDSASEPAPGPPVDDGSAAR